MTNPVWLTATPPTPNGDLHLGHMATGPIQFFGFDNGYFHAVHHPALFMACDEQLPLASAFVVNELYLLEGVKFSTSRRHAVWAVGGLAAWAAPALLAVALGVPTGGQADATTLSPPTPGTRLDDFGGMVFGS